MENRIIKITYVRVYEFEEKDVLAYCDLKNIPDEELKDQALLMANNFISEDMEEYYDDVENFASAEVEII
jgi:K+/H+ antiporter YhaU regulatory subunit KhtT